MVLGQGDAGDALNINASDRSTQVRRAAFASAIGTTIEWYDFFLYNTAASLIFPALFFPASSTYAGTIQAFATYAVGFAARPVGAAFFGTFGDRIGRKATLIITLVAMGLGSALVGVLPGTASIGVAAPILLVLLRVLQGIAIGGEWSGSVLLTMEWGDQRKRGLLGSFAQIGVPFGLVLGTGGLTLLSASMSPAAFAAWGWRIPFLFSLVLVGVGLVIRLRILETPMFAAALKSKRIVKRPVMEVIRRHPKEILLSACLRLSEQAPYYLFTSFVLTYLVNKQHHYTKTFALNAVLIAAIVELFTIPLFARLSDGLGRKQVYLVGAILTGLFAFPYFGLLDSGMSAIVILAVIASLIPHAMQYGPQAALIGESFPTHLRYGGAGLGYQLASVIAGGPAPLIATYLLHATGGTAAISIYIIICAVLTVIATVLLPDRSRADITDDATYGIQPRTAAAAS